MSEKIARLGLSREADLIYYVAESAVWGIRRKQRGVAQGDPQKIADGDFLMDDEYVYFLDEDGDVARVTNAEAAQQNTPRRRNPKSAEQAEGLGMKALTVKQPWAWAILFAGKDVENRNWSTNYRGPLIIHAGASMHGGSLPKRLPVPIPTRFDMSAMLGIVDLVDVVEHSRSRWFQGDFGWVLKNPRPFEPIPCKGMLRLWSLSPSQVNAVEAALRRPLRSAA